MHCDYMVHFSVDLSLVFTVGYSNVLGTLTPSFTWNRGGVWMCKLGIDVNTVIDK